VEVGSIAGVSAKSLAPDRSPNSSQASDPVVRSDPPGFMVHAIPPSLAS